MKKTRWTLGDVIIAFVMIMAIFITLYPFIYVLSMSLSEPKYVLSKQVVLLPKGFSIDSYRMILQEQTVLTSFMNSIWYTVVGTLLSVSLTFSAGYVLSRRSFFLRRALSFFMTLTMFINGGLIPLYIVVCQLGLYNSRWAIILPYVVSTYNLIICRSFLESIPESMAESARIDGANDWIIMLRIYLPLSSSIIAVLILFYGVGYWNSYFAPLIFLSDKALQPIQLYLRSILITSQMSSASAAAGVGVERALMNEQLKYSTIVVSCFPIAILYPFVQRHFVKGVMIGAVKA
ncbi:MAG: carbohydrate ABC transporter permease [Eubacteriales bacterium]|nr:carbohydrate ABC transporter permease [Eubacteriales bacterium]